MCTVLLYRLTGKLINYFIETETASFDQWRATPSGSCRAGGLQRTGALKSCILGVSSFYSVQQNFFIHISGGLALQALLIYEYCSSVLRVTVRCKSRLCFSFLFLYVPFIECLLISFGIGSLCFRAPRGTNFICAPRDYSLQISPMLFLFLTSLCSSC